MTKISEKQLIEGLKTLKQIKPRQEWASLLKSQILAEPAKNEIGNWKIEKFIENLKLVIENSFTRRVAYSFAALMFVVAGVFGFASVTVPGDLLFPVKKMAEQSQASLLGQTKLKQDVVTLNNRVNDLAQVAKAGRINSMPSAINEINENVKDLTKNLREGSFQDSETLKEIASSLKILADVPGADLTENENLINLYQTVVVGQIIDLEQSTLTDEQKIKLEEIKKLYEEQKYTEALENILLINNVVEK